MSLRLPALFCLLSLLVACASTPPPPAPAPRASSTVEQAPPPLTADQRELSGQLLGVPANGNAELALLLIDQRDRPLQMLASTQLTGTGQALAFNLRFTPRPLPAGTRLELRGRVSQAGVLTQRLLPRPVSPSDSANLGALQLVSTP